MFDELERWPVAHLNWRAAAESWSARDVVEHLVRTERAVLNAMETNLREGVRQLRAADRLGSALVLGIMVAPTRFRVPNALKQLRPSDGQLEVSALREVWARERQDLRNFLGKLTPAEQRAGIFRHHLGCWTTATGGLLVMRAHLHHHSYQLSRIRKGIGMHKAGR